MKKLGSILRWFFGVCFMISGLGSFSKSFVGAVCLLLLGLTTLPLIWRMLKNRGVSYKRWIPVAIPFILFICVGIAIPAEKTQDAGAVTKEISQTEAEKNNDVEVAKDTSEQDTADESKQETDAKTAGASKSEADAKTAEASKSEADAKTAEASKSEADAKATEKSTAESTAEYAAESTAKPTAAQTTAPTAEPTYNLTMHVIDVGQGLALLFESGGEYMLYDGGDRDYASKVVSYLKKQNVTKLRYVIASHYDADHLNGIVGALNVFPTEVLIAPSYTTDTNIYTSFQKVVAAKKLTITAPKIGTKYMLGNSSFTILAPSGSEYTDVNDYSVAIHMDCNQNSFLISGDATATSEAEMIASGQNLDCDVFVAGHHGSAGANSQAFVQSLSPAYVVISCKEDNQYQHPSQEVMERLQTASIPVFRTDKQGDIVISSDGANLTYSVAPCNDYSYGTTPVPQNTETSNVTRQPASSGGDSNFNTYNTTEQQQTGETYVLNTKSKKFHYPDCKSVPKIAPGNYATTSESRDTLMSQGYSPCGNCHP